MINNRRLQENQKTPHFQLHELEITPKSRDTHECRTNGSQTSPGKHLRPDPPNQFNPTPHKSKPDSNIALRHPKQSRGLRRTITDTESSLQSICEPSTIEDGIDAETLSSTSRTRRSARSRKCATKYKGGPNLGRDRAQEGQWICLSMLLRRQRHMPLIQRGIAL